MDSSTPLSPVQSSDPPSSPAQWSSPTILSSPDSSSPSEMTLCNSSQRSGSSGSLNTMSTMLNTSYPGVSQDSKPTPSEYLPYPPNPSPLELRYAARVMKSKFQPEFSLEETQKLKEQLESGLSQMTTPTLYKGYKAKLTSREVARQHMVLAMWEIDEVAQYEAFLISIYGKNKRQVKMAEGELQGFRKIFSQRGQAELEDDRRYLQAVYEDECEILRVTSAQTDQVANLLSSCVKRAF
ncbi:hypothetical protein DFJ58DRAFT_730095 [Suillus subalutaceus]|uniref:uncharacterized protein n=1 Tax=Suillus subalutaceus TaxID=48586 RepID=UPI001B869ED8|nr:uncharacterized protein DFJ58DRAFT_730095 [Suillus subalutaceus]KAG1847682.1 hypothetical protein DFJ58DRAFT_730095 [Suillus subalutaceus]